MVSTILHASHVCTNLDILTTESSFRPRSDPCTDGDFFPEGVPGLFPSISTLILRQIMSPATRYLGNRNNETRR